MDHYRDLRDRSWCGDSVTYARALAEMEALRHAAPRVAVAADGTCVCKIEGRPAHGEQEGRPGARLVHQMDPQRLARLQELLEDTQWLTAPGGEGPALHTDADEWTITVVRDGESRTITCHGRRPEPYASLIWFFRGIAHQENLLYHRQKILGLNIYLTHHSLKYNQIFHQNADV